MDGETINQTIVFGCLVVCGGMVGMAFDIYRFFKMKWALNKIVTGFIDLLFCVAAALLFFYFVYHINYGQIRGYIVIGFVLGWLLYKLTLGKPVAIILDFIYNWASRIIRGIIKWSAAPWTVLFKPRDEAKGGEKKSSHSRGLLGFIFKNRKTI
ncbi:MAG TPA: hypothetical protein GXZ32_08140 [Clostridiales bacterium]|nr:hypothetical protein [Clostridiales bacterium]